jgi:spore germination cell wall hydrolase CwlJ-like protein
MSAIRRNKALGLGGAMLLAGVLAIPVSMGFAAETPGPVPLLTYDVPAPVIADEIVDAQVQESQDEIFSSEPASLATAKTEYGAAELECLTKAVHREAGNQSREGKLAVAQLVINRMNSGRFAHSICGVVNQRGQFFQTSSYNPRRDTTQWSSAETIAREALGGSVPQVVPGAVFFHATYIAPNSWFRTRQRVATLGQHIFYR